MTSKSTTVSIVNDVMTLLVEYGNQRKPISVTFNDDLHCIECKIYERFKFHADQIQKVQIQWYDEDFRQFIDLDSKTWPKYVKNEHYWNNTLDSDSQRNLRLVHKQLLEQNDSTREQHQTETNNERNGVALSLNNPYTIVNRMPAHQTSGITEHKIGSQLEHMNQSIHTDWVLNGLGWLLPLIAVLAYVGDGIWVHYAYDSKSKEQHNYAGLVSTILILFYYLQYDVKINTTHPKLYFVYQSLILCGILTGDILYAHYYGHYIHNTFQMTTFIIYGIIDSAFVLTVGYLKGYRQYRVSMGLSIHNLFHLMSRLEVLLIVLIPIFTTYDVISTNSIAFFILYEFFSHTYNNPDLIYSGYSRLSFWLLIIFATVDVICQNFEFVYDRREQDAHDPIIEDRNHKLALGFQYATDISEVCASAACYVLLLLQFFSLSDKRKKITEETRLLQNC